jgi:hypothetical protein
MVKQSPRSYTYGVVGGLSGWTMEPEMRRFASICCDIILCSFVVG